MPSTILELFDKVSLNWSGVVKWGELINCDEKGIYIVSLSKAPDENTGILEEPPIDHEAVCKWIERVPNLQLDNKVRSSSDKLVKRLGEFWLRNENILYIGQTSGAETNIGKRVRQFYSHCLGKSAPHKGGHWIKTLSILNEIHVHYVASENPKSIEQQLIKEFAAGVSKSNEKHHKDLERPYPFANVRLKGVGDKIHGIKFSTL